MKKIICFGEIMLRLSPEGDYRFNQTEKCETFFGGSEANVAVALAQYGMDVAFISKVPDNRLGHMAVETLRRYGVDTSHVVFGGNRLGIYLLEKGTTPCSSICTYDRAGSSMATASADDFDWDNIFDGADWFHFSGITPAISKEMFNICLTACQKARKHDLQISCDINYRSSLWPLSEAKVAMRQLCRYADILMINEDEGKVLTDISSDFDITNQGEFNDMVEKICTEMGEVFAIASAARVKNNTEVVGRLWCGEQKRSPYYPLHIVDPCGAGDAFAAALIYTQCISYNEKDAISFATAACAAKHRIKGDFNLFGVKDIQKLADGPNGIVR